MRLGSTKVTRLPTSTRCVVSCRSIEEWEQLAWALAMRITDRQVDADWWEGTCKGKTGLFPAAYVVAPEDYQP